jgi:hypothetical protein
VPGYVGDVYDLRCAVSPDYRYTTPLDGLPGEAIPTEFDDVDTALVATDPRNRGPMESGLFERSTFEPKERQGAAVEPIKDVDTDKIETFPEAARMVEATEFAAKWEVVGLCHDAMTEAGISLTQASKIMAVVVAASGLVAGPANRGPNGTLLPRFPGDAPHRAPPPIPADALRPKK